MHYLVFLIGGTCLSVEQNGTLDLMFNQTDVDLVFEQFIHCVEVTTGNDIALNTDNITHIKKVNA